jgi:hypothetical protein
MDADAGVLTPPAVFITKWLRRLAAEPRSTRPENA